MTRRRAIIGLALVATLVWCLLLFGIGLDDLTDRRTHPGVIFSLVVLPLVIGGACYGLWRMFGSSAGRSRQARRG